MATTNIWQQFKSLIPEGARTIITITSNNGNGTSTATLRDGTTITVQGESMAPGKKALMEGGSIRSEVPDLSVYAAEV
ncbi:hypothetical protein [Endozoicomonas montiporae]|uniref:Proteasome-activating nucleotidase-like n=1 Tax=Endozoicomonas montiporae CL-33 TaxID=570277 RepID=A0A142BHP7_9GAMM|nr:hypothetical protein [Endozoicomonas montiporae]AMO58273.1 proteasome-activating nucleotidase-like [Endozoicomonas montiporae CL-33]